MNNAYKHWRATNGNYINFLSNERKHEDKQAITLGSICQPTNAFVFNIYASSY